MSWAEIKKAINSNITTPLDTLIKTVVNTDNNIPLNTQITNAKNSLSSSISDSETSVKSAINTAATTINNNISNISVGGLTSTTAAIRTQFANAMKFTQKSTINIDGIGTVYIFVKNNVLSFSGSWDLADSITKNYYKLINKWSSDNGYGDICLLTRLPAYTDTASWFPTATSWLGTKADTMYHHHHEMGNGNMSYDAQDRTDVGIVPVAYIV